MLVDACCGLCIGCVVFFFVLCGFVLGCGVLVLFLPHCIVYYRVPGLHYSGALIGSWSVCLPTVSFPCEYVP